MLKYRGKGNVKSIDEQVNFLKSEEFPVKYGLFENNVIWRRHLDKKIIGVSEEWWNLYLVYSKRDQLGLMYCLWKHHVSCIAFMPDDIKDHRKSEHFEFTNHNQKLFTPVKRWKTKFTYILKNGKRPSFRNN